jgi:hypothetical protein
MIRKPSRKKQGGDIGLRGSKILSQCRQWTFPVVECQEQSFERNQGYCNGSPGGITVRDSTKKNVKNAGTQEEENQAMQKPDGEDDHGSRIVRCGQTFMISATSCTRHPQFGKSHQEMAGTLPLGERAPHYRTSNYFAASRFTALP